MLRVYEMCVHVQSHLHAGLGMRLVEQPPPRVPHTKYPVHAELPHLKYVVLDITVFQCFLLRVCCKYKCASLCCRVYALKARGTGKPGPAEEAGIRVNDIIVSINDTEGINSTEQVCVR